MSESDRTGNSRIVNNAKRSVMKRLVVLGAILAVTLSLSIWLLPVEYLIYFQSLQVGIAGYLVIEIIANTAFRLVITAQQSDQTANSLRSLIRILGGIVVAAIVLSFLSQNAAVAASIGTLSALVIGFASQNLLGNMIADMYLSLTRPFKIDDVITVFGNSGKVLDIGLLNCELLMSNGDIMRAPSSSLLTSPVIIRSKNTH
ncbi:Small-conductance mechanosensitive channel [Candidatus Nitrosocosmicus oleophilus]|uniref:Small-conductance mechanosensitive channel n=1 Tax=Candidatus Nitrosocosmicus oleophilus TaxID=1353260 RepID=A0A654M0K5_9ARCH|nr:mechanosensitive ion channel domain-containing protein [Candidatus Nitrosocosmicus oleophilus]ALI36995.1 Small-conductance mechanosensitive channel [Candidatus Nitrosocosmicus oleophilus]